MVRGAPEPATRTRTGYTIVEVTIAATIVVVILGILMEMYSKSNTVSAKGIWRVSTVNQLRSGLREVSRILTNSSYPARTTSQVVGEVQLPAWGLTLDASNGTVATSGSNSVVTFQADAASGKPILSVWNCQPETDGNITPAAINYLLQFSSQTANPAIGNTRDVQMITQTGTYSLSPSGMTQPTAATSTLAPAAQKTLIRDVESIRISIPQDDTNSKGTVTFNVVCRDNVDGKLRATDGIIVEKNVQVTRQ